MRKNSYFDKLSPSLLLVYLLIGIIVGSYVGEIFAYILPASTVKEILTKAYTFGFDPIKINLNIIKFDFGFKFKVNIMGIVGFLVTNYILRWW